MLLSFKSHLVLHYSVIIIIKQKKKKQINICKIKYPKLYIFSFNYYIIEEQYEINLLRPYIMYYYSRYVKVICDLFTLI